MNRTIILREEIAPHFHGTFKSKFTHQADCGGRGSTKTSKNALKVAYHIMNEDNISAVVMRKHSNKIRRSVFKEILRAFKRLGIEKRHLRFTMSPMEIEYKPNGNMIYFTGIENIDDIKGVIDEDRPIKIVWLEELTQFTDEIEINNIVATFVRGNDGWFSMLYSWNSPQDLYHWIYDWLEKMKLREDFLYTNTTYETVPRHYLGELFYKEAEALKVIDEDQYNFIYLNIPTRLKGKVYKKWDESLYVGIDESKYKYRFLTVGVDYGETDGTSFTLESFPKNFQEQHFLRHYYHKNGVTKKVAGLPFISHRGKTSVEKDVNDYVEDFFKCIDYWHNEFDCIIEAEIDSANKFLVSLIKNEKLRRGYNWLRVRSVNKVKINEKEEDAIEERINALNYMLGAMTAKFSQHPSLYELKKAISQCMRNDKGKRKDDGTQNIDSLDSMEYGYKKYIPQIRKAILLSMMR